MTEIEVLQPGLFSTIQDQGRFGFMKFGVPLSGAMDKYSAKLANMLLQNSSEDPVLEITQMGPKLKFNGFSRIVICGANLLPRLNEKSFSNNISVSVRSGDVLDFGGRQTGCRSYLGISGGFKEEEVLGSRSWYEGLTRNYRLEKGRSLYHREEYSQNKSTYASIKIETRYVLQDEIKVFPGPEFNLLPIKTKAILKEKHFSIDKYNSRMAVQLAEPLQNVLSPILTRPVIPGTIQLTPSGRLIVLMSDCQTTGGYPRILQLKEEGMNTLAQKIRGDKIFFKLE